MGNEPQIKNYNFNYTGEAQSVVLKPGVYKLECWGAQGGSINSTYYGGKGGYSVGLITIMADTTIYVRVGGQGGGGTATGAKTGGFNGGGAGYTSSSTYVECGGGGASDVRIDRDSIYARVIVAGGGGGAGSYNTSNRYNGGYGGGTTGGTGSQYSTSYKAGTGGSETVRGTSYYGSTENSTTYGTLAAFGVGGSAISGNTSYQIAGGGGGWYGGGYSRRGPGGGGSGYVYTANTASNYPSGSLLNSSHYLTEARTVGGNTSFPSTGGGTETGHAGNGYVKITFVEPIEMHRVTYIENKENSYINTKYYPNNNTKIVCSMQYVTKTPYGRMFGCKSGSDDTARPCFELEYESSKLYAWYNTGYSTGSKSFDYNRHTYTMSHDGVYVDGTRYISAFSGTFSSSVPLAIFTCLYSNGVRSGTNIWMLGKLYSFKIYSNDTLVRDFIPIRVGSTAYLYENVSGTIYVTNGCSVGADIN